MNSSARLIQPPFQYNCLNWAAGHLAETRNGILQTLGQPPVLAAAEAARYGYGSQPVTCQEPGVVSLEELLAAFERAQEGIATGLRQCMADPDQTGVDVAKLEKLFLSLA